MLSRVKRYQLTIFVFLFCNISVIILLILTSKTILICDQMYLFEDQQMLYHYFNIILITLHFASHNRILSILELSSLLLYVAYLINYSARTLQHTIAYALVIQFNKLRPPQQSYEKPPLRKKVPHLKHAPVACAYLCTTQTVWRWGMHYRFIRINIGNTVELSEHLNWIFQYSNCV